MGPTKAVESDAGTPRAHAAWLKLLHRGAAGALVVSVIGAAAGFGAHVLVARLVGKQDYGAYALMLSWVTVLAVVAQAGQDSNVVRFLPGYVLRGEWGRARGLRLGIGWVVFGISAVAALAGCAVVAWVGKGQGLAWRATFYIGFAMLPVLTQLQQNGAIHRAFKHAMSANAYLTIGRPVVLAIVVAAFFLTLHRVDAPLAALASFISALVAWILSASHLSWAWPRSGRGARPMYEMEHWLRMGMKMSILSWVIVAGGRLDVLLLGALLGTADVGPYFAAVQLGALAFYGLDAVNVILAPMIAERYEAGDLRNMESIVRQGARLGLAGGVGATIFFALLGRWILEAFGHGFDVAYLPLLILLVGYCAVTAIGPGGFVLSMTRYQHQASLFAAVGLILNAAIAVVLIPRLGAVGAAIGAAAQLVVWHSLTLRFVIRRVGINSSAIGRSLVAKGEA